MRWSVAALLVSALALGFAGCAGRSNLSGAGTGGAATGGAGTGGASGSSGSGGGGVSTGGAGGAPVDGGSGCEGRDYCACKAGPSCVVLSEACFCPCGERCEPASCACVCGGGKYLGCTASSITAKGQLDGIWLVGWSGGLNHYSWVRFDADGTAHVLDGSAIGTNAPYWPCSGTGSWLFAQKPETVFLTLPAGCATPGESLTFSSFKAPEGGFPKGAVLGATLEASATPSLEAWKFAGGQCNAAFTVCEDPFGFPP